MSDKGVTKENKVWLVTVSMGYGHQRTSYNLKHLACDGRIIEANRYPGIPGKDRKIWQGTRKFYEFISNFKKIPVIGNAAFSIFDTFQRILSFYPKRDLSQPNFSLKQMYYLIKKGWGRDLIERLKSKNIPLISTFFIPAFMAEFFGYPGKIFCVVCDADIARPWASLNPKQSRIKYLVPTERVAERLRLYGVKKENIFLTGYPLPLENIGDKDMKILKESLKHRLLNLDPLKRYFEKYKTLIDSKLGVLPEKSSHPLTITFSVGGAGAQKEIGLMIVKSLIKKIKTGELKIVLVAGTRRKVRDYFLKNIKKLKMENNLSLGVEILFESDIQKYFHSFDEVLKNTDILWTKPSELSFYTGLGLPEILAPPIGSQEEYNRDWLLQLGSAMVQKNPLYADQWISDLLNDGWFAEAAMQGFVEAEQLGVFNIQKIIFSD